MKILLVRPYYYIDKEDCPYIFREPLGLEYLKSYAGDEADIEIFDMLGIYWNIYKEIEGNSNLMKIGGDIKDLFSKIEQGKPDVIGITSMFLTEKELLLNLTKAIKTNYPQIKIIVGGPHPSCLGKELLNINPYIDILVIGEGEETLKELIRKKFENLPGIQGIIFKDKRSGKIIETDGRCPVDINSIPFPARDAVPYKNYNKTVKYSALRTRLGQKTALSLMNLISNTPIDDLMDKLVNPLMKKFGHTPNSFPSAAILTSRSCPNRCTFCAIRRVWSDIYRMRSAEDVINEIKLLVEKYHIRHLAIQDDNFTVSKDRTIKICKAIIESKFNITMEASSGIYIPSLDEEVLTWLKKAGLNFMYLGVESGSQNTLTNIIKKRLDLKKVDEVIDIARAIGIKTGGYFIIGFPGETLSDMKATIDYALNSKLDMTRLYLLQPFPGSEMYETCVKNGYLTSDYDYAETKIFKEKFYIKTPDFKPEQVEALVREGRQALFKAGKLSSGFFNK